MVSTHSSSSGETESESESEPMKTSKPAPTSSSSSEESESESEPNTTSTPKVKTMPIEPAKSSSSSEESESESEPEPEKEPSTTSTPKVTTMPIEPAKSSSSSEESDSESETEKEPSTTSTPKVKTMPIEPAKSSSSESESEPGAVEIDQSKAAGKRPMADTEEAGNAKRPKMEKQLFQRLYSEENEIELIQGMITFVQQNAKDPLSDAPQFYEFVKGSLTVDVTFKQMLSKIRKLKLKFRNNAVKIQTNGKVKSLNNVHEKKMFELSEKVWGNDVRSLKKVKTVRFGNGSEEVKPNLVSRNKSNIPDEITRRIGFEELSDADKTEMEKKWKDIKVKELELYIKKVGLMKEQAEILLNATIKSGKC